MAEVFNTLQVYLGSLYVNDFNRFGRTWQVNVQASADFRKDDRRPASSSRSAATVGRWCRSERLPASQDRSGPVLIMRYNMYPAAAVNVDAGTRRQLRPGHRMDGKRGQAETGPVDASRVDRAGVAAVADRQHGHAGVFRAGGGAGVPGAGRPVRKLVAAAGRHPGGADVSALLDRGRAAGPPGRQHLHAGRLRRPGRPGVQERHPDRRIRQGPARGRDAIAIRPRWKPAGCGCGRSS